MAYETGNPPHLRGDQPVAAPRDWVYSSTHLQSEVGTSDFISNGQALGMALLDTVTVINSSNVVSIHCVNGIGSTYTGLTSGLLVSSAS